jgi:bacteriocin biosynthesis cyclodehydratase domain-containing protein
VVLTNVDEATTAVLALLDGRHSVAEISAKAEARGVSPADVTDLLALLARCGAVVDGEPAAGLPRRLPAQARRRLRPDLAALSLSAGADAGALLARRADRSVEIHARGRIGPVIAALLAASGVRRVHVRAFGTVEAGDALVGGLLPSDEHRPYATAAAEAILRVAPEADTRPLGPRRQPDLVVLADSGASAQTGGLARADGRAALLPVALRDGTPIIGPLVVPGHTACLGCVERHRLDRDPAWPALAAQLTTTSSQQPEPCQTAIAAAAAGIAASQALCYLDGDQPEALGRSLELTSLGGPVRTRTWSPHPRCDCAADRERAYALR